MRIYAYNFFFYAAQWILYEPLHIWKAFKTFCPFSICQCRVLGICKSSFYHRMRNILKTVHYQQQTHAIVIPVAFILFSLSIFSIWQEDKGKKSTAKGQIVHLGFCFEWYSFISWSRRLKKLFECRFFSHIILPLHLCYLFSI